MKNKVLTGLAAAMMLFPWTIFLLRRNAWALESPAAEIIIACYILFMIWGATFSIACYTKGKIQNKLMQVCLAVNSIYAIAGIAIGAWAIYSALV